jgi:integrase/recombinase XerD
MNPSGARDDAHLVQLWLAQRPESTRRVYGPVAEAFIHSLALERPRSEATPALMAVLREATAAQVISWAEGLQGEPATRARKVSTVKSLLTFAWRTGYTVHNVGRVLRCCRVPSKVHERILEEPDVKALLGAASPGRDRAFLRLMYCTGARVGELCGLRWIDLAQPGRMSVLGKGQKVRTLVVPAKVLDEVLRLRPMGVPDLAPVFTSLRRPSRGLDPRDAREIVYRTRQRAGLAHDRRVSPHWLRHSHATHALDHGCQIHVLQQSLGHANVSTTSTYLHVRPNRGSADCLDC